MQTFAPLGEKPINIRQFWENFKIYIQKSQWKIDFLPIFSPILQDLSRMLAKMDWGVVEPGWG